MRVPIFLLGLFFIAPFISNSQTFIGVSVGGEYTSLEPGYRQPPFPKYYPDEIGVETSMSFNYGLRLEQYFTEKYSIVISGFYTNKNFHSLSPDAFLPAHLEDNSIKKQEYALVFNKEILNKLYLGIGGSYSTLNEWKRYEMILGDNKREYGGIINVYYRYRNFVAELRYNHGLLLKERPEDKLVFMRPTRSLSLSVSYLFQVLGPIKRNGKAMDCPTF